MYWGYSPALDFFNEIAENNFLMSQNELNILIIGSSDGRHILKTISKYYKLIKDDTGGITNKRIKLNFYIYEAFLELYARQLLLFLIAFEPTDILGLKEKTHLFMEVYGNTLTRPKTSTYIYKKTFQLIHCITDLNYLSYRLPMVDLSLLKYKERDQMEIIFKFWRDNSKSFNIEQHWNKRLRQALGVRYDAKEGVYDWDYHMKLKDLPKGSRINSREYRKWRDSGIAFTWLETELSEANPTLATGIFSIGDKILHHGYLGDIFNGPYITFGLDCEDTEMLKTMNGVYAKRATDITERNLLRLFWELQNSTPYVHPKEDKTADLGVVITELTETTVKNAEEKPKSSEAKKCDDHLIFDQNLSLQQNHRDKELYTPIELLPDVNIIFLPQNALNDLPKKSKYKNFFHLIWFAQNLTKKELNKNITNLLVDNGIIFIENKLYLINLDKKDFNEFPNFLNDIFINSSKNCDYYKKFDHTKDIYASLTVKIN